MIVMKFGGTSLEDARAIQRAIEIVKREQSRQPLVVLSAVAGTTSTLLRSAELSVEGDLQEANKLLNDLFDRHVTILQNVIDDRPTALQLMLSFKHQFEDLRNLCQGIALLGENTPRSLDTLASVGGRLSSRIVAEAMKLQGMNVEYVDARKFIITDAHFTLATPLFNLIEEKSKEYVAPFLEQRKTVVTQGFIGATQKGITTTLGRGGSDYTASILGAVLEAEEIQIWTDVDDLLTADPQIAPAAQKLNVISFREASELAYFGANVFHPSTILPAVKKNIPVVILNSKRPNATGTRIVANLPTSSRAVQSIASKKNITIVNVVSSRMLMAYGFLESVFHVFGKYKTSIDLVSTSEVAVSLTIDDATQLESIVADLEEFADVSVFPEKAIVCIVGEQMYSNAGAADRIFRALNEINVVMISQSASKINMSLVVEEVNVNEAVRRLHKEFFEPVAAGRAFEPLEATA
jgi:aspartate kinase